MKIGVIADTHGLVFPSIREAFEGVDHIVHAGDVGAQKVIEELGSIAPVTAIRGNHEPEEIPGLKPDPTSIQLAGVNILITHRFIPMQLEDYKDIVAGLIKSMDPSHEKMPQIVVFGHTHYAYESEISGIYFMNPGYCGPDKYEADPSVGLIEVSGNSISGKILPLE